MKKPTIITSMYIVTFIVATAGFYIGKIEAAKEPAIAASSLSDNPGATAYQNQRLSISDGEHRSTDNLSVTTDLTSEYSAIQSKNKWSVSKPAAIADDDNYASRSTPEFDNDSDIAKYLDTDSASSRQRAGNYAASLYNYDNTSSNTGTIESTATIGASPTIIDYAAEIDRDDTTSIVDTSSTETSSSLQSDDLSPTAIETIDEQALDEQTPDEAVEEQWATPDCPYLLAEGSSEEYANSMTETYGCQYRNSCVNQNDGSGTYYCRWQYIRTS